MTQKKISHFDKYQYYLKSVQSPENDVQFIRKTFQELKGKAPISFAEDFCGTFMLCCEWVKLQRQHQAVGVDLDLEPLEYGKTHHLSKLKDEQRSRMSIRQGNVLDPELPESQIIAAMNFSYFLFKQRSKLKEYFLRSFHRLSKDGIFLIDAFGGPLCHEPNEEETVHEDEGFSYFWDQDFFDPVNNHAIYHIHFKRKGEKKREKVFSYDWRMWSIPELRDLLEEVGFEKVHVYWEGTNKKGEGNGVFKRVLEGEPCEAWVCYLVAEKSSAEVKRARS